MRRYHVVKKGHWTVELYRQEDTCVPYERKNFRSFKNAFSYFRFMSRYHKLVNLVWKGIYATTKELDEILVVKFEKEWFEITGEKYFFNSYGCAKLGLREI